VSLRRNEDEKKRALRMSGQCSSSGRAEKKRVLEGLEIDSVGEATKVGAEVEVKIVTEAGGRRTGSWIDRGSIIQRLGEHIKFVTLAKAGIVSFALSLSIQYITSAVLAWYMTLA